jgi:hypothetical protein
MAYSDTQETAWSFDLLCALWVLSSVLGPGVQVARGSDRLALNLYILLVAPSGVARKSTALGLLTDVYDCHTPVYPTFLAASTPTWLAKSLTPEVITGGFGSRLLTVTATRPKRTIPWPEEREDEQGFLGRAEGLLRACDGRGVLTLTSVARSAYTRWYANRGYGAEDGDYVTAFASRQPDHVLKLSGLLSLNRGAGVIDRDDVNAAQHLVDMCARAGAGVFGSTEKPGARSRTDVLESRIDDLQRILERGGTDWVSQATLTQHFAHRLNARGLRAILDAMHDLRMVQRAESTGRGRTTTLWRGTTLLREVPTGVLLSMVDKTR